MASTYEKDSPGSHLGSVFSSISGVETYALTASYRMHTEIKVKDTSQVYVVFHKNLINTLIEI
jgi:hypothetical protein